MKIGVIGSGEVGQTLAEGLKKHAYETRIASRTPGKLADFSRESGIAAGTFADVAGWAEAIVFAVNGSAAPDAIKEIGAANLDGKTVIDTTNPIAKDARPEDGVLKFFTPANSSLMEQLQAALPRAKFVKAFNSVGADLMVNPSFPGGAKPTMFYCGNDDGAKAIVAKIIDQFGWDGADMGTARAAGPIESLCLLWCIPGFLRNQWDTHAFHLLKR